MPVNRVALLVATILALGSTSAHADSDGYYCIGAGFLAAEFRSFNTPGLRAGHVVRIALLDTLRGARWSDEIVIEDFQTHVLACATRMIIVEGASGPGRGLVSYVIRVDTTGKASITEHTSDPAHRFVGTGPTEPPNLGDWATPGVMTFMHFGGGAYFQLRVTRRDTPISASLIRHNVRSVIECVVEGRIRSSLVVHEGHRDESIDDDPLHRGHGRS
jgi:hypothetical protein